MIYYQIAPTAALRGACRWCCSCTIMFTLSISLLLAMANLFYRDVKYLFELVLTIWMFLSAVLYPVSQVAGLTGRIMAVNPMTPILEAYRDVLLRGRFPDPRLVPDHGRRLDAMLGYRLDCFPPRRIRFRRERLAPPQAFMDGVRIATGSR